MSIFYGPVKEKAVNEVDRELSERIKHIETLLQNMPELIATVFFAEKEKVDAIHAKGSKCTDHVHLPSPEER